MALSGSEIGYSPSICRYGDGRLGCVWAALSDEQWHIDAAVSADDGLTWSEPFAVSQPEEFTTEPRLVMDDDTCFVAWQDNRSGNWEIYFTVCPVPTSGLHQSASQPSMRLAVFPNPANGVVRVRYTLEQTEPVRLVLLDVTGRLVAELANERQPAGVHTACWRAARVPAGVYYCRLQAGTQQSCGRLELLC